MNSALSASLITPSDDLFAAIGEDIYQQGYSIQHQAMPAHLIGKLCDYNQSMSQALFREAGIGRKQQFQQNEKVRNDEICWIDGNSDAGREWIDWCDALKTGLNRQLMLGLFSFESHFAYYRPGHFYKRHYDAFKGQANRVLSLVTYLNNDWQEEEGGELVLYLNDTDTTGIRVLPQRGTVVVFLSEEFPHEVLSATRGRSSIACWFRVNNTQNAVVDPPR